MELRKDPITMSWVIVEDGQEAPAEEEPCPLCPGHEDLTPRSIYSFPYGPVRWQVRVVPHPRPLYQIEGDAMRRAEGLYDRMRTLGAHEIVVETPNHTMALSQQTDENAAQVLCAYVARLADLKRDTRFRYVTLFRNQGKRAGQDLAHPHTEITATPFIPRRMAYELRSARRYFNLKERCLLCDIVEEERSKRSRLVDDDGRFIAFCPFASRVPYETWVLPAYHHCHFEKDLTEWNHQVQLARFLKSILQRLEAVTPDYHLVLHTSPNTIAPYENSGNWQTLSEDYHWHFEILPVLASRSKPYSLKEVYYNSRVPETAARELRGERIAAEVPQS